MNLRLLEIFRAVMDARTATGAAKALNISQPAVSAAIRQLEKNLGFPLFDRMGNRIIPTAEAKILFTESESIFLMSQALGRTVQNLKDHRLGNLRIIATPQLGHTVIPNVLYELLKGHDKIKTMLDVRRSYHVIEAVQNGLADVGLAVALEKELSQVVEMLTIASVDMVCLLTKEHPLAGEPALNPKMLTRHRLIGLEMGARLGPLILDKFRESGVPYQTNIEVRYSQTACVLAQENLGIAVVDRLSAVAQLPSAPNLKIIPFSPATKVDVSAITPKNRSSSYLTKKFIEHTKTAINNLL
ncbi:MAG TPA: LysR family transcriptional regulator [Paenalcaligenes sp.]|nr:LysR family transcriptional regulator [Paenalcaligenes sp.]